MTATELNLSDKGATRAPASIGDSVVRHVDSMCRAAMEGRCAVRALAAWAKRFGLTEADFQLLWRLRFAPGDGLDQTALADELCLSQSQISATVERMRACGWVRQRIMPGDRRRHLWLLSAGGQDLIDQMLSAAALLRSNSLSQNRRGLAHFAESSEQNVPGTIRPGMVPLSADGSGIGSKPPAANKSDEDRRQEREAAA